MSKKEQIEDSIKELDETINSCNDDMTIEEATFMRDELIVQWEDETGETWID